MKLHDALRERFQTVVRDNDLSGKSLVVDCKALTSKEAIGTPEEQDYPIQFGKETMVEATFQGHRGQAFSREAKRGTYSLSEVAALPLEKDWERAVFVAALNAVFAACGLADRTVHCKDQGPALCARRLREIIAAGDRVGLFGLQPRFLEVLAPLGHVRCVDLDPELVGARKAGTEIEGPENTGDVLDWCDVALVTGSALVNDTFATFLCVEKPLYVFGTTGAAAARILQLPRFCYCNAVST